MQEQPMLEHAVVHGEKVLLRPLVAADAAAIFPLIHAREEITKWLVWDGPKDVAELEAGYEEWAKRSPNGDSYHFAICDREDGRIAGSIGARFLGHPFVADLGYWLAEEQWGRGFVSEAILLISHLCFNSLATRAMTAEVFVGNEGSTRVLQKNAFLSESSTHRRKLPDGSDRQAHLHTLTARAFKRAFPGREPVSSELRFVSSS